MSDLAFLRGTFVTPYNYVSMAGEVNYGEPMVETAGYIPAKKRIEDFLQAGMRLQAYRAEQFDFPDGTEDPNFSDPTRDPGFDLSDASDLALSVKARLHEKNAQKAASDASKPVLDVTPDVEKTTEKTPDMG